MTSNKCVKFSQATPTEGEDAHFVSRVISSFNNNMKSGLESRVELSLHLEDLDTTTRWDHMQ